MDLLIDLQRPAEAELRSPPITDSATVRDRVTEARQRQQRRLAETSADCNGELDAGLIQSHVRLDGDAQTRLGEAYLCGTLSARGRHRVLRVAQTLADLAGRDRVSEADVLKALALRQRVGDDHSLAA